MTNRIQIANKQVFREYEILETFTAGIVLTGTEIKSIRQGKATLADSWCYFKERELYVKGMQIAEYALGTCNNHVPDRDRKLLLNRSEMNKLQRKVKERGFSIVTLKLFINATGLAKLEIALARGKAIHDKREDLKKKDVNRELARHLKR
ncbi:MAG: SsrA-binding protein [Bacteroidales bacterium]|jgi:SsrA-binding protein|nr:SsrA-binding protein [Bacteroidales bacterium]NLB17169.1 SsrA-binding protein [Syntrophomonadaceae bacterium]MDD2570027.1 SsrA-binding protein [Bacteroidales bacterium]MDD3386178.1 SsrA-binding protein [Bacteroidales bacterium]MDD3871848.1 SsrA-binding protein [Bacteroidales bacterium]